MVHPSDIIVLVQPNMQRSAGDTRSSSSGIHHTHPHILTLNNIEDIQDSVTGQGTPLTRIHPHFTMLPANGKCQCFYLFVAPTSNSIIYNILFPFFRRATPLRHRNHGLSGGVHLTEQNFLLTLDSVEDSAGTYY